MEEFELLFCLTFYSLNLFFRISLNYPSFLQDNKKWAF